MSPCHGTRPGSCFGFLPSAFGGVPYRGPKKAWHHVPEGQPGTDDHGRNAISHGGGGRQISTDKDHKGSALGNWINHRSQKAECWWNSHHFKLHLGNWQDGCKLPFTKKLVTSSKESLIVAISCADAS
ncbi:unnamed protein product [Cladocopium goreaui]|uniref:Uncharacterized protein n=1 Tax=Cladocopium goreaui TaxID=2562237 RepID=A0A9P1M5P2_9DINO|nr:unnamed protein product [Cladocopium goreaui]